MRFAFSIICLSESITSKVWKKLVYQDNHHPGSPLPHIYHKEMLEQHHKKTELYATGHNSHIQELGLVSGLPLDVYGMPQLWGKLPALKGYQNKGQLWCLSSLYQHVLLLCIFEEQA